MYSLDYDDGFFESHKKIERAKCKGLSHAVKGLIEELYESAHSINSERIRSILAYMCDETGADDQILEDGDALCVVHVNETRVRGF